MLKALVLPGIGLAMWVVVTLFFMLFGDWVLVGTDDPHFGASLFLLEALTLFVLVGLSLIVRLRLFPQKGSATRLGYWAAAIGLPLNAAAIWNRGLVFSDLDDGQLIAYTIWMTGAYALTLLVPAATDRLIRTRARDGKEPSPNGQAEEEPAALR